LSDWQLTRYQLDFITGLSIFTIGALHGNFDWYPLDFVDNDLFLDFRLLESLETIYSSFQLYKLSNDNGMREY